MFDVTQESLADAFDYKDGCLYWKKSKQGISASRAAGTVQKNGYITIKLNGKRYYAHRLIFLMFHGYFPDHIDHANLIKSDNRIENLRECSLVQNSSNTIARKRNKCGLKGVSSAGKNWCARKMIDGKDIYLGTFKTKEEAHSAYCAYNKKVYGKFARG